MGTKVEGFRLALLVVSGRAEMHTSRQTSSSLSTTLEFWTVPTLEK